MNFSMTEQEKGDYLIEVSAWEGLTVDCINRFRNKLRCIKNSPKKCNYETIKIKWIYQYFY